MFTLIITTTQWVSGVGVAVSTTSIPGFSSPELAQTAAENHIEAVKELRIDIRFSIARLLQ